MAWIAPKTNWVTVDGIGASDLNRIEGNIQAFVDGHQVVYSANRLANQPIAYFASQASLNSVSAIANAAMPRAGGAFTGSIVASAGWAAAAGYYIRSTYFSAGAVWPGGYTEGSILAVYT